MSALKSAEKEPGASLATVLLRGLRCKCPRCGTGPMFRSWYTLLRQCRDCGLSYERLARDTWALIYVSTAALTGVVIVGMIVFRPFDVQAGRFLLACIAAVLIVLTLPYRKGVAIALNHIVESRGIVPPE